MELTYKIFTDTTTDLTPEWMTENNVGWLEHGIVIDGKEIKDDFGKTVPHKEFYQRLRGGLMPTTTQVDTPKTGYDEALRAQIERETQRRSEQIENVRRLQSEQSALEHLTFLCPSAEDAAKNPDFAPIRARMLAKIHILRTREAELENLLAKLQERFGTLLKAQVRLAQGEAPSDVARDLYATQSVTETDRLYEAVLADQTPEGR